MSNEDIREVFRKIASGERKHGDFLTIFAQAMMRADEPNEALLRPAAAALIVKYDLAEYAKAG